MPGANVAVPGKSTGNNIGENLFYDLDTKQLNSEEIRDLIILKEDSTLPDISVDDNLFSFSDVQSQDNNMTDSIERFAKFTIDNMYQDGKSKNNT